LSTSTFPWSMIGSMTGHWEPARKKLFAFGRRWWKRLIAFVGVAGVLSGLGWLWNQYQLTTPSIHFAYAETDAPFSVPFVLTNQSPWLHMFNVNWYCYTLDFQDAGGTHGSRNLILSGKIPVVFPLEVLNYYCPVEVFASDPIVHATVCIFVTYKTFDFDRFAPSKLFHWDNRSRRWLDGAVVGFTGSRKCEPWPDQLRNLSDSPSLHSSLVIARHPLFSSEPSFQSLDGAK
jgi:hypothetical protein